MSFSFSTLEDVRRVRSITSWNLSPSFLKLFSWTKDFNPTLLKHSSAQVWICIHGLAQEYWRPKIVFVIESSVGIPLCTDSVSNKCCFERPFGHIVRVLVNLDLNSDRRYKVLVEKRGYDFFVNLEYESLPDFCNNCNIFGHCLNNYKRRGDDNDNGNQKRRREEAVLEVDNGKKKKGNKKIYVQVNNGLNATESTTKEKVYIINLEAQPSNVPTVVEKGVGKDKRILSGNDDPLDIGGLSVNMEDDTIMDET